VESDTDFGSVKKVEKNYAKKVIDNKVITLCKSFQPITFLVIYFAFFFKRIRNQHQNLRRFLKPYFNFAKTVSFAQISTFYEL
jgi:hypothetical protein